VRFIGGINALRSIGNRRRRFGHHRAPVFALRSEMPQAPCLPFTLPPIHPNNIRCKSRCEDSRATKNTSFTNTIWRNSTSLPRADTVAGTFDSRSLDGFRVVPETRVPQDFQPTIQLVRFRIIHPTNARHARPRSRLFFFLQRAIFRIQTARATQFQSRSRSISQCQQSRKGEGLTLGTAQVPGFSRRLVRSSKPNVTTLSGLRRNADDKRRHRPCRGKQGGLGTSTRFTHLIRSMLPTQTSSARSVSSEFAGRH